MVDENDQAGGIENDEEDGDDLCDDETELDDHEITGDEDLPATTGGVEE